MVWLKTFRLSELLVRYGPWIVGIEGAVILLPAGTVLGPPPYIEPWVFVWAAFKGPTVEEATLITLVVSIPTPPFSGLPQLGRLAWPAPFVEGWLEGAIDRKGASE
jgi:hypothetical protein